MAALDDYQASRPNYSQLASYEEPEDEPQEQAPGRGPAVPRVGTGGVSSGRGNSTPSQYATLTAQQKVDLLKDRSVFTVPQGQEASLGALMPGGIQGLANTDSYLFITQDVEHLGVLTHKGWRAFIVSKDDPHNQREVVLKNVEADFENKHEFRATLGDGHTLVIGKERTTIDNNELQRLDDPNGPPDKLQSLVKQRIWGGEVWGEKPSDMYYSGDSWVVMKKDLATGQIRRFTQSGTGGVGRLEVIQGDPVNADKVGARYEWTTNGETARQTVIASNKLVPLPEDMRMDVALQADEIRKSGGRNHRMWPALENLTNVDDVLAQNRRNDAALAEGLNAQTSRQRFESTPQQEPKSVPLPKPAPFAMKPW